MSKNIALIICCFVVLMMSWESQKIDAAVADQLIPEDSIRLRILANSDGPSDQVVKRLVRDAVVEEMNSWVSQLDRPESLDEARGIIQNNMPEIKEQVRKTLQQSGKNYSYDVELGVVPFPTKMYGGAVYPAGDYEALRITLGAGEGKNWWCVLFPPLCFVGAGSGDAIADNSSDKAVEPEETEVRFFVWDVLVDAWDWLGGLFS